jgi:hypothetical protein
MRVLRCRNENRSILAIHCFRSIYFLLVQIPIAITISVLTLAAGSVTIVISVFLCLVYRIIWYLTPEGRLFRYSQKVIRRQEKIKQKERMKRIKLSRNSDRKKIGELISIIRKELDQRKNEIKTNIFVLVRIQLRDCMLKLDFDAAMEIYQALAQTKSGTVNQRLGRQLGLKIHSP